MKYLIIGRTAAGKDTLADALADGYGLARVKSATTRPRRDEGEDTHVFVTETEATSEKHKVASTVIDGHEYYATFKAVSAADVYVIDPEGARELSHNMPKADFHIVYLSAPADQRRQRFIERAMAGDPSLTETDAAALFEQREAAEDERFSSFEGCITTNAKLETWGFGDSVRAVHVLENDYDTDTMAGFARMLANLSRLLSRVRALVPVARAHGLLSGTADAVLIHDNTSGKTYPVSDEWCADTIVGSDESLLNFVRGLLIATSDEAIGAFVDTAVATADDAPFATSNQPNE